MPFGISRAKNSKNLEIQVSKPTLAVSGNTPGRVGFWEHISLDTPFREADTGHVSWHGHPCQLPVFHFLAFSPDMARVGQHGWPCQGYCKSFFLLPTGPKRLFWLSIPPVHLFIPETKRTTTKDLKWSMMVHITCTQLIETTIPNI
jgi:hypothetical protein